MKLCKKVLALVLALVCLCTCFVPVMAVEADAATLTVTPSSAAVAPGETFSLTVAIKNNPGLWSIAFNLPVDTAVFEFVSCNVEGSIFSTVAFAQYHDGEKAVKINMHNNTAQSAPENVTADGTIVTITLKALEAAALANYTLTAAVQADHTIAAGSGTSTYKVPVADGSCTLTVRELVSEFVEADVAIGTDVTVNFYATLTKEQAAAQVVFTMNGKETTVDAVATDKKNVYRFSFKKVAPQCMGDSISAVLTLGGKTLDSREGFSVRSYCDALVAKTAAALGISEAKKAALNVLAADLLAYGAAAQNYRSYKTDALANAGFAVTASKFTADLAGFAKKIEPTAYEGLELVGAGLYYSNTISLYLQFTLPANAKDTFALYITNPDTKEEIVYEQADLLALENDGTTYTLISKLGILNLDTKYSIELGTVNPYGRFVTQQYVVYGGASYVYSMQDKTDGDGLSAMALLARATYNYGAAAKAYAGA